jgi:hypothetical protein
MVRPADAFWGGNVCDVLSWQAVGVLVAIFAGLLALQRRSWDQKIDRLAIPEPNAVRGKSGITLSGPKGTDRRWVILEVRIEDGTGLLRKVRKIVVEGPKPYDPPPARFEVDGPDTTRISYGRGVPEAIVGFVGEVGAISVVVAEATELSFSKRFRIDS